MMKRRFFTQNQDNNQGKSAQAERLTCPCTLSCKGSPHAPHVIGLKLKLVDVYVSSKDHQHHRNAMALCF